ncbi:MAG: hypothetical protein L0Y71_18220 [Gemmataceae bacterium]|nr:hypothetical protein [Gemmataceae bacterium]
MASIKRTYAFPKTVLDPFEAAVPAGERGALLAGLVQEWLDRRRRAQLRQQIAEGCAAMADVYLQIEREYHPLEEEVERVLEEHPKARRRGARPARSRRRVGTGR